MEVSEYELARKIHRSMLPPHTVNEKVDFIMAYREFNMLGGDYCTAHWQDSEKLFFCVCDVTGHGLAAALLAARINTFVRLEVEHAKHPCEIVEDVNAFLVENFTGFGIFPTFFCTKIDFAKGKLQYAGAGHPPALIRSGKDGQVRRLESQSPLLGIGEFSKVCSVETISYEKGDVLLLYTDGIIEARNAKGEFFELERLESILASQPEECDAEQVLSSVLKDMDDFASGSVDDDVLVLCAAGR